MSDQRKQGTVFNSKSVSTILKIVSFATFLIAGYIVLYGDDRWFAKEKGEAIEKKQVVLGLELDHRHEMHMQQQKHIIEKLDELKQTLER